MRKKWLLLIPVVLFLVYLAGPAPKTPVYDPQLAAIADTGKALENFVQQLEAPHKIKKNNEARIVWFNDSLKNKTPYSIVYLHGFSASQEEGDPVHKNVAAKFGCNLFLSRLAEHGIDTTEELLNLTPENYWESAKTALAIGKQLGNKVILMSSSTGGTLALKLAADFPGDVYAMIMISPNIEINDKNAWLLNNHWGLQIAHLVLGSDYLTEKKDLRPENKQYWNTHYRAEAAVALQELLETTMHKETFERVKQPVQLLYYYKDSVHQDSTVKVSAMLTMFDQLGTPSSLKQKTDIPTAGNHVMGSWIKSHDVPAVQAAVEQFIENTLHINPVH